MVQSTWLAASQSRRALFGALSLPHSPFLRSPTLVSPRAMSTAPTFEFTNASPAPSTASAESIQPMHVAQEAQAQLPHGSGQTEQGHAAMTLGAKGFLAKKMAASGCVALVEFHPSVGPRAASRSKVAASASRDSPRAVCAGRRQRWTGLEMACLARHSARHIADPVCSHRPPFARSPSLNIRRLFSPPSPRLICAYSQSSFHSPTDQMVSPCTKKLAASKQRHFNK